MKRRPAGKVVKANVQRADLSERDFQKVVVNFLEEHGWIVMHVGPGRTGSGEWVTATTAPGWPDLHALRRERLLAIEVKDRRRPVEPAQAAYLLAFSELPTANAWVVRPTMDWRELARWIVHPETAPVTYGFDPTAIGDLSPFEFLLRERGARRSRRGLGGETLDTPPPVEQGRML